MNRKARQFFYKSKPAGSSVEFIDRTGEGKTVKFGRFAPNSGKVGFWNYYIRTTTGEAANVPFVSCIECWDVDGKIGRRAADEIVKIRAVKEKLMRVEVLEVCKFEKIYDADYAGAAEKN